MISTPLRHYQREAIAKALAVMREGGGFGLFLEQRAGKTRTALEIAAKLRPQYLWVICPKAGGAAPEVWWGELEKFSRNNPALDAVSIRVENYEQWVIHRKKRYAEARTLEDLLIISDESHWIKTRGAARSRVVRRLGKYARWRLALTGTPIAQGIQDAWAQFDFIDPEIFGPWDDQFDKSNPMVRTHVGFNSRYLIWGGYKDHDVVGYTNEDEFYEKFHAHCYRITLREARNKPLLVKYTKVSVELTRNSRRIYEDMKELLVAEVDARKVKVKNVLACIMKLQQIAGGEVLHMDDSYTPEKITRVFIGNEKLEALRTLVRGFRSRTKLLIVARFIHEITRVAKAMRQLGYTVREVRGGKPYDGKFEEDCIVLQEQSGIAVDMSAADDVLYYSMDYSVLNFEQSRFRALTYDKPSVRYYFLLAADTVDEDIYLAVTKKRNLARLICDTYRTKNT